MLNIIQDLAIQADGTKNWFSGHDKRRKWLILHGTAGFTTAKQLGDYFKTVDKSVHYGIGQDGEIRQFVDEANSAWGNAPTEAGCDAWWNQFANPNYVTFSIEHVKPHSDNSDVLTPAQQAASFALIKAICQRNGIPMRAADANGGITGHFSIEPQSRARCPGPYPWDALWAYLKDTNVTLPQGWHDDKQQITIDGSTLVYKGGMRSLVLSGLSSGWLASGDVPLENERYVSATRIEQYTAYHLLVFNQKADGTWEQFYSNIGNTCMTQAAQIGGLNSQVTGLTGQVASLNQELQTAQAQAQADALTLKNVQAALAEAQQQVVDLAANQITNAMKQAAAQAKAAMQPNHDALDALTKAGL